MQYQNRTNRTLSLKSSKKLAERNRVPHSMSLYMHFHLQRDEAPSVQRVGRQWYKRESVDARTNAITREWRTHNPHPASFLLLPSMRPARGQNPSVIIVRLLTSKYVSRFLVCLSPSSHSLTVRPEHHGPRLASMRPLLKATPPLLRVRQGASVLLGPGKPLPLT